MNDAELSGQQRNPIVLPKNNHIAHLLIGYFIKRYITRDDILLRVLCVQQDIGLKLMVYLSCSKCVACRKLPYKLSHHKMADLPENCCIPCLLFILCRC